MKKIKNMRQDRLLKNSSIKEKKVYFVHNAKTKFLPSMSQTTKNYEEMTKIINYHTKLVL